MVEEVEELTQKQKDDRLKFAQDNTNADWKLVLLPDEKLFQLPKGDKKQWQDPDERVTKKKVSKHAPKVMVWGGIGYYFKPD